MAILLLATFTAANFARIKLDKAEGLLDATDARTFEHGAGSGAASAVGPSDLARAIATLEAAVDPQRPRGSFRVVEARVDGSEAASAVGPSDLARAIAALEAAVDQSDMCRALGDPTLEISVGKLDAIRVKLADLMGDSLAKREKLYDAAGRGEVDVVKDLVKQGVNVNSKARRTLLHPDGTGTPLQHAVKEGYPESVRVLLEAGADKDSPDENGRTPLWYAAQGTRGGINHGVIRVLLEAGANTASASTIGNTPLHVAASRGHEAAVHLLLEAGANKDATNDEGNTPLFWAANTGSTEVVRTLLKAGSSSCLANNIGETPITVAKTDEIRKMLEAVGDC